MQSKDTVEIETPEGVRLELALANVGSRGIAVFFDHLLQLVFVFAVALFLTLAEVGGLLRGGIVATAGFFALFGYPIAWEVWGGGSTPGKRWNRLSVVRADGTPVRFVDSAIRNLVRLVDLLGGYVVASVSVFVTSRNQRLGDLAAGTLVVRLPRAPRFQPATSPPGFAPLAPAWDVSAIAPGEVAVIRRFLERRAAIDVGARRALAAEIADRVRPRVAGALGALTDEQLLEGIATIKRVG